MTKGRVSTQGKEVIIWEAPSKAVKSSGMVFHQVCSVLFSHRICIQVRERAPVRLLRDGAIRTRDQA